MILSKFDKFKEVPPQLAASKVALFRCLYALLNTNFVRLT